MSKILNKYACLLSLTFCSLIITSRYSYAAVTIHPNAGTTSASFLKLGVGSRAVAMGSAFTALSDDVTALYWNPAGLAQLQYPELSFMHNNSFESINSDFAAYSRRMMGGTAGIAMYGIYTPQDIERRSGINENDPYEPISSMEGLFRTYDTALHFSYARNLRKNFSAGMSLKFIQQTIDTESAYSAAADIGLLYHFNTMPLSMGFVTQHAGLPIKFRQTGYPLPTTFKLGAAYRWTERLITTLDLSQPIDNFLFISAGTEYSPIELLSLRAGYRYRLYGLELGDLSGLSAGFGFNLPTLYGLNFKLDYAYVPYGVLGNSHRLSLGILFGEARGHGAPAQQKPRAAETKKHLPQTVPQLPPQPDSAAPALDVTTGYTYYNNHITSSLKMVTGKFSTFAIKGDTAGGDIISWNGTVKSISTRGFTMETGETIAGNKTTYGYFTFRTKFILPVVNATIKLRVPRQWEHPSAVTENGKIFELEKTSSDDTYYYYTLRMDMLRPFTVIIN